MPSIPMSVTMKRPIEEVDDGVKKIKIEKLSQSATAMATDAVAISSPNFTQASTLLRNSEEISDEDLLRYALEFEKKHGI